MGAVLMQKDAQGEFQPIEFMSKAFNATEYNWHITTKELFCVIKSIEKWDRYLHRKFTLYTDSKNIEYLFKRTNQNATNNRKHYRWATLLKSRECEIK